MIVFTAVLALAGLAGGARAMPTDRPAASPAAVPATDVWSGIDVTLTSAQKSALDGQVARVLRERANAKRISINEVAWTEGGVEGLTTFPVPGVVRPLAAADCPFQYVCVYDGVNFGYPRERYFNCGTVTTPPTFGVTSWHNNQTNNTESWLEDGAHSNLQSSRAPSKVSYVGVRNNDQDWYIHVC